MLTFIKNSLFLTLCFLITTYVKAQGPTPLTTTFTGTPASCVITAPHANAYFTEGNDIRINVYASDIGGTSTGGSVTRVEFFVGTTFLGSTTVRSNNTFTYLWQNAPVGNHILTARAVDNSSNVSASAGVFIIIGTTAAPERGLSACKGKYLANIVAGSVPTSYLPLWNGVTAENSCKWGVVESSRDNFNWSGADVSFNLARNNNLMFRYHAFAWGSQFPGWAISTSTNQLLITPAEFREEMEEYIAAVAQRYGNYIDQIDVLNEQLRTHAPANAAFKAGLGGPGSTGYDWAIWLFQKARQYFPNAKLVLNDYGLENDQTAINEQLLLIRVLRDRNLIDGFGTQAHQFNLDNLTANQMNSSLNLMATGGVPIYVTELDLTGSGNDQTQSTRYQTIFPAYWNHYAVAGISLWGYEQGRTWINDTELIRSNGTDRPAMTWLRSYIAGRTDVGYPYCTSGGTVPPPNTSIISNGEFDSGTLNWEIQNNNGANGTMNVVTNAAMSGTNALRICAANAGTADWHVQVRQNAPFEAGKTYEISFLAKSDAPRIMNVAVQMEGDPWTSYFGQTQNLSTTNQLFTYTFSPTISDATAKLKFYVGNSTTCVTIDNIVFKEVVPCVPPTATITAAGATTVCQGNTVVLNAATATGNTYQWRNGTTAISGATASSYTASGSGSYAVVVTSNGCSATSTPIVVTVQALPTATITAAGATTVCQGNTVVLNAATATGNTYQWRNGTTAISGATASSYTASGSGSYAVVVTSNGCSATSTPIVVTVQAPLSVSLTPNTTQTLVLNQSITLTASTSTVGASYEWFRDGISIGNNQSALLVSTPGTYYVRLFNSICTVNSTSVIVLPPNQTPLITNFIVDYVRAAPGSTSTGSINISVQATDFENNNLIVEILDGVTLLTTLTNAPFNFTFDNPSVGSHDIVVRVSDGNTVVSDTRNVVVLPIATSATIFTNFGIECYPNPYSDRLNLKTNETIQYTILNILGQIVENGTINGDGQLGENLETGIYVLFLQSNQQSGSIKIEKR